MATNDPKKTKSDVVNPDDPPDRLAGIGLGDTSPLTPEGKREQMSAQEQETEEGSEAEFLKRIEQEGPGDLLDVWMRDELARPKPRERVVQAIRDRLGVVRGPGFVIGETPIPRPEDRFKPENQPQPPADVVKAEKDTKADARKKHD